MPDVTMPNLAGFIEGGEAPPPSGERRELPEEFQSKVWHALESTIRYAGRSLAEADIQRRRDRTEAWLEGLRWGNHYDDWCQDIRNRLASRGEPVRDEEREAANARAETLLRSSLTPEQLRELDRRNHFHVTVGERRFRICRGRSHNVKEVDAGCHIHRTLCAHPIPNLPDADTMLGQKLLLETHPDEFFRLANVMRRRHRPTRPGRSPGFGYVAAENLRIARELHTQLAEALDATALTQGETEVYDFRDPPCHDPQLEQLREEAA